MYTAEHQCCCTQSVKPCPPLRNPDFESLEQKCNTRYVPLQSTQTRITAGEHTIRVCVAAGGFTLDGLRFAVKITDIVCDKDGT